jgi:hypothetical protein
VVDFSQPLVLLTDKVMQQIAPQGDCGETHAMRIDVTIEDPSEQSSSKTKMVSFVQAQDSFHQCVGQSCAEFALDLVKQLNAFSAMPGIFLPEQRYSNPEDCKRIISKLTSTPRTFCWVGPVTVSVTVSNNKKQLPVYPSRVHKVIVDASST